MATDDKVPCPECGEQVTRAPLCPACGSVLSRDSDPYCGKVFGSYRCLDRIGRGGTAFVYKAEHVKIGIYRAVKILRPEMRANQRAIDAMWSEARAAAALRQANLPVFHEIETHGDGTPYSIWDLIEGQTLLSRGSRSPLGAEAAAVGQALIAALEAVHDQGLVHLDLCPQNVVLARRNGHHVPYLVDFGEARKSGTAAERATEALRVGFSAPEQVKGGMVDARTDVFALGALLVHAATGRHFIDSRDLAAYADDLTRLDPAKLQVTPLLPTALATVAEACLAPERSERPPSMAAVRDLLTSTMRSRRVTSPGDTGRDLTLETPLPISPGGDKAMPPPKARLEAVAGVRHEPIDLDEVVTLGRSDSNRVVLDHPTVSKRHARIWVEEGLYHVEDLGSRNGTSVNGRRVAARKELKDGDALAMGEVVFRFRVVAALA